MYPRCWRQNGGFTSPRCGNSDVGFLFLLGQRPEAGCVSQATAAAVHTGSKEVSRKPKQDGLNTADQGLFQT